MFTGIVKGKFPVVMILDKEGLRSFIVVLSNELVEGLVVGASVAVDGVCFTVTGIDQNRVSFDAMEETLRKTTIGSLQERDFVNIERSARMGDEIGGHFVYGHVDGRARVMKVQKAPGALVMTISASRELLKYMIMKGTVAVDGVSLTIMRISRGTFTVSLLKQTRDLTSLGIKHTGDDVNIEVDMINKFLVERCASK